MLPVLLLSRWGRDWREDYVLKGHVPDDFLSHVSQLKKLYKNIYKNVNVEALFLESVKEALRTVTSIVTE